GVRMMVGIPAGNEFQVNTTTIDSQDDPNVAVDAQGNYVVVWQSGDDGSNSGIFAQRYDRFGNAIGGEIEIAADDTRPEFDPVVGMDANGNFVVSWTDDGGDNNEVRARRFDSDGNALGDAFLVNTETADNQDTPDIAMNANGQFVITWESLGQDGDSNGIFAQVYDAAGNPVGDEIAVNDITNGSQDDPVVAIDDSGNFVIAWEDSSTDIETVNARRFDSTGNPIGDSFVVSTTAGIDHDTPDIAMNASGEFVIAWESFDDLDGDRHGIFAQRYNNAGERIGDEIAVNTTTAEDQDEPSVAIDADGNFLITWESDDQDGSEEGIFGQYFDNTGAKQGDEFQINTFTEDSQADVALTMTPDGNAIAVWDSFGQDGDGEGIFAQQLAVPSLVEFSQPTFTLNEDGTVIGAEVTLTRDNDIIESEVQVSVAGGTATAGLDFTNVFPLTVTFAVGETTQTISIPVLDDALEEGTETLELNLTATETAEIGTQNSATVNIVEDVDLQGTGNDDNLRGEGGNDIIRGRGGDDTLRGLSGDDRLIGGGGNDRLRGGSGNDNLRGNGGNDRLIGGSGNDTLNGNGGDDRLVGQSGDDLLNGGGGNDRLRGGAGSDELIGGRGNDTLIGGSDSDIFVLRNRQGTDLIRDFNIGEDFIQLQGSLSFRDLSFQQQGRDTVIEADGESLATLRGVQAGQLDRASFV
ncbi:MAG: Calx-beta domain-containing protein, partial [Cyanobacteria bacterium J06627_8]